MVKLENRKKDFLWIRRILTCILIFLVGLSSAFPVQAGDATERSYKNSTTGYEAVVYDMADLLSDTEEKALLEEMQPITAYGGAAFVSVDINYTSTSVYAEDMYRQYFGKNSGTLFVIDMDNHQIYIFSDGAIYKIVNNQYATSITDNVYRYASNRKYYACAQEVFAEITTLLSGAKIAQPMKYICNGLLALILALLTNYVLSRILSRTAKPGRDALMASLTTRCNIYDPVVTFTNQTRVYDPPSSSSSGGGGGHSGGGGGGHSGGGGGHSF